MREASHIYGKSSQICLSYVLGNPHHQRGDGMNFSVSKIFEKNRLVHFINMEILRRGFVNIFFGIVILGDVL